MISIEFFGSPGSGKTTIRNFLAKEFEKMSIISNMIFKKCSKKNLIKITINGNQDLNKNVDRLMKFFKKEFTKKNI